jgi:hypothetical protein
MTWFSPYLRLRFLVGLPRSKNRINKIAAAMPIADATCAALPKPASLDVAPQPIIFL